MLRTTLLVALALALVAGSAGAKPSVVRKQRPVLTARQAAEVRVLLDLLDAFNAHDPDAAIEQFAADENFGRFVGAADCDYRRGTYVRYAGRRMVLQWLRERSRDRDQLALSRITMIGARGADVAYSARSNDTLRAIGVRDGLRTGLRTKIGFTTSGPAKVTQFANANACKIAR